jgi:glyoxylase-like metal-dependent hydrolase (beta-lactamase superfamily II)
MSELPPAVKTFGLGILSGAKDRKSILDVLATVNEPSTQVARIIVTHAHYDHLGGATELSAPVYVSAAEAKWMAGEMRDLAVWIGAMPIFLIRQVPTPSFSDVSARPTPDRRPMRAGRLSCVGQSAMPRS